MHFFFTLLVLPPQRNFSIFISIFILEYADNHGFLGLNWTVVSVFLYRFPFPESIWEGKHRITTTRLIKTLCYGVDIELNSH